MRALAMPNLLHGAVEFAFEGPRERNLWRLDMLNGSCCLLILSQRPPDLASAVRQFGYPDARPSWETKPYEPLLQRIESGSVWHFRLTANPTVSQSGKDGKRGKVLAHVTPEYQKRWLMQRAEKGGFALTEDGFEVIQNRWLRFQKEGQGRPVSLLAVTFEGTLTVTDTPLFCQTLKSGIGRGKAYGMGLLTIAGGK